VDGDEELESADIEKYRDGDQSPNPVAGKPFLAIGLVLGGAGLRQRAFVLPGAAGPITRREQILFGPVPSKRSERSFFADRPCERQVGHRPEPVNGGDDGEDV
jgi:hypothetical protein